MSKKLHDFSISSGAYLEVSEMAKERGITVPEMLRQMVYIQLGYFFESIYNAAQIADALAYDRNYILSLIRSGEIKGKNISGKIYVTESEVRRFAESRGLKF